ncbi:hypothetical protein ScalyP_jg5843 [Parmales sp. scaly parma]|nr:hypothetical protein ScalyP_jg5843 [Parmales sp. scaly parma]
MVLSSTPTKKRKLPPPPSSSYSGAFSLVHSALLNSLYSEELDGVQPAPAVVSSSPPSSSSSSSSSSSPSTVISAIPQFITYKTSIHENRKNRKFNDELRTKSDRVLPITPNSSSNDENEISEEDEARFSTNSFMRNVFLNRQLLQENTGVVEFHYPDGNINEFKSAVDTILNTDKHSLSSFSPSSSSPNPRLETVLLLNYRIELWSKLASDIAFVLR